MVTKLRTLNEVDLQGKTVILRVDINSDIRHGKLVPAQRLDSAIETIKKLRSANAKIVVIAHQGSPKSEDFISLKQHFNYMKKFIPLTFSNKIDSKDNLNKIRNLKNKEVILLENIRFSKKEFDLSNSNSLIKNLSSVADAYINDAFSVSHRKQASIILFPKFLPSYIGPNFEKELKALDSIDLKEALLILGGSKPLDYLDLINKTNNKILATGLFAPFCLVALGYKLGKENERMKKYAPYFHIIKKNKEKIILPVDLVVENNGKRVNLLINQFPVDKEILDIGDNTINLFSKKIKSSKAIVLKGLVGLCNTPNFTRGTKAILQQVSKIDGFTLVSGGHTTTIMKKLNISESRFSHVSLSGGALLEYLVNKKLPGIQAITR